MRKRNLWSLVKTGLQLASIVAIGLLAMACNESRSQNTTIVIQNEAPQGLDGLDLKAVGELVKKAQNAQELEKLLNQPGGINNVDLDHDGAVNYINVAEFNDNGSKGFTLSTRTKTGDVELAKITVKSNNDNTASVAIQGNPQYYPVNNYYHASMSFGDALLLAWLFTPHPLFYHPFYYPGFYPVGYAAYGPVSRTVYAERTSNFNRSSNYSSTTRTANNGAGAKAGTAGNKNTVTNPNSSQKSFSNRSSAGRVMSGGFGKRR